MAEQLKAMQQSDDRRPNLLVRPAHDVADSADAFDQLQSAHIVMVDDEPIMLEITATLLEDAGYSNFSAIEDSSQAMDILTQGRPDILLLDLVMPDVDGFAILEGVRNSSELEHLPVIVLTSSSDPADKLRALSLGATDFLAKPVDASELALRVRNTLAAKAYQDQLAYYDNLTGLPNRRQFLSLLEWGLKRALRDGTSLAVLHVALDNLRGISDTVGPALADEILKVAAERVSAALRDSDILSHTTERDGDRYAARFGSDDFSVALTGVDSVVAPAVVTRRLLQALKSPVTLDGHDYFLICSIGIAVFPQDGDSVDGIVRNASAACDHARSIAGERYCFFSRDMNERSSQRMRLESKLRRALSNGELRPIYQPKVAVDSGQIAGMECLLRWSHPEDGSISPATFIPVAEETGLIVEIGEWILERACEHAKQLHHDGGDALKVAVNVSGRQLLDQNFKKALSAALRHTGLDPSCLVLEITESIIMDDIDSSVRLLNEIKNTGVRISIDDFGTGYSSLSYLKKLPIDELKIDQSFVKDIPESKDDIAIVRAIVMMAKSLGLSVVCEGIETAEQMALLKTINCDLAQGYYLSRPLEFADLLGFVRADTASGR
ncbi:MAG: EAL domain-containing protein [Alphaproteobacteria bacterium]